jgi:MHS family proline/betaine transporter-like MFS transporter
MGGAASYIAEASPSKSWGALVSTTQIGCIVGTMLDAVCVAQLSGWLTKEQLHDWGWRVPFLLSLPLGFVSILVRRKMEETPQFKAIEHKGLVAKVPFWSAVKAHPGGIFKVAGLSLISFCAYYLIYTYMVTYFQRQGIMSAHDAGLSSSLSMLGAACTIYFWGALSDRIGRKPMLIGINLSFLVLTYPLFELMHVSITAAVISQFVLGLVEAACLGVIMSTYCELFPASVRTSGVSLGFNIAAIVAGGSAPYLATWIGDVSSSNVAPAWLIIATAFMSLCVAFTLKETAGQSLMTDKPDAHSANAN